MKIHMQGIDDKWYATEDTSVGALWYCDIHGMHRHWPGIDALDRGEFDCLLCQAEQPAPQPEPASLRTPDGGSAAYRALLDEAWDLHIRKNTGYAGYSADPWANFRECEAFGIDARDGVLTRMSDKWSRLQSLWRNPEREQVGEPIEDTLKDLAAYANILVALLREKGVG